jgi:translation initiation factor IF-2
MRVFELAKILNKHSKEILEALSKMGIKNKAHTSSIEKNIAEKIKKSFMPAAKSVKPKSEAKTVKPKPKKEKTVKPKPEKVKTAKPLKKTRTSKVAEKPKKIIAKKALEEVKEPVKKELLKKEQVQKEQEKSAVKKSEDMGYPIEGTIPEQTSILEAEEEVKLPDRFKKELEVEKVEKFKYKPGMQRAFQTIRKIEPRKWHDTRAIKKGERSRLAQKQEHKAVIQSTMPRKKTLKLREGSTVKEFSELIGLKFSDVIKKFMELGYMPTINQPVDTDAALLVADSFGVKIEPLSVEEDVYDDEIKEDVSKLLPRAPIVTIMGHVDHGKTSLLDAIRETRVTETEAGGITQHIGAYKVKHKGKEIGFLDTPGHEAFTLMRARGAKVTDIVVLVVAADDGVMPQTVEAINHAKAANVPIVVAINKIDKPEANIEKVKSELSEHGIISEKWGGHNIFVEVSAKQRIGIEHVLEMIILQAEIMELKANPDREPRGIIIEAKLDRGRGPIATLLVQTGTLKVGDALLAGIQVGKVRALIDDSGKRIQSAGPSTPIEVIGFSEVPSAGDVFNVVEDEKRARQVALARHHKQRSLEIAKAKKLTLDELYTKIKEGQIKELNIIIKGDVHGSVEAIKDALENITHPDVKVKVIHSSVGGINESDVMLAAASNAIIIGFNVRPETKAAQTAEKEGVDTRLYNVIYEAIEDVRKALEGLLEPTLKEKFLGRAEVRKLFGVSKLGTIAGSYVIDGYISRASDGIRVLRESVVIYDGKINTLKRFQDDVKEVQSGYECGILLENFNDIKVGDILENYIIEKIASKL